MPPSGLPTGTVSSGRTGPSSAPDTADIDRDTRTRIAELERENEALRAAVERQRRENERIVERYERLLDCDGAETEPVRESTATTSTPRSSDDRLSTVVSRLRSVFGR